MTNTGRYQVTYLGNGIIRLPRAGIFQTGTRAVVDETIARIATAHGCFAVVSMDAPAPMPQPAPVVVPDVAPPPVMAAPPAEARRPTRRSQAIRTVRPSEAISAIV